MMHWLRSFILLYRDGFRAMKLGKTLWLIIGIKFFLFFIVMKLFFFQDTLQSRFTNDADRAHSVIQNLIQPTREK